MVIMVIFKDFEDISGGLLILPALNYLTRWLKFFMIIKINASAFNLLFRKSPKKLKFNYCGFYFSYYPCLIVLLFLCLIVLSLICLYVYCLVYSFEYSDTLSKCYIVFNIFIVLLGLLLISGNIKDIYTYRKRCQLSLAFYLNNCKTKFKINSFLSTKIYLYKFRVFGAFTCQIVDNNTVKIKDLTVVFEERIKIKYHGKFYIFDGYADLVRRFDKEVPALKKYRHFD